MNEQPVDGSKLTDGQIVTQAITLGFMWHYPGRIRIGQILEEHFGCDWKRIEIIRQQIVDYGIARYADSDEADLLVNSRQAKAIESGDPIEYMEKWREEQKPKGGISIGGSVIDSQVGQGSSFGNLASSHNSISRDPIEKQAIAAVQEAKVSRLNIWQRFYKWSDHKYISMVFYALTSLIALWIAHYFGWFNWLLKP